MSIFREILRFIYFTLVSEQNEETVMSHKITLIHQVHFTTVDQAKSLHA